MQRYIRRTAPARRDYDAIFDYIASDNPNAASSLLRTFDKTLELILATPKMGRAEPDLGKGIRSFVVGHYVLFYREFKDGIELLRVIHGARDIPSLFKTKNG